MAVTSSGILSLYSDSFIKDTIDSYLSMAENNAESLSQTFNELINQLFIERTKDEFTAAFKEIDSNSIDDMLWLKASSYLINNREYLTYSNVGSEYYKLVVTNFISINKTILINEFIIKYCNKKEIRSSIMNELLLTENISERVVGTLLNTYLNKEQEARKTEDDNMETLFTIRSKESYTYELPVISKTEAYFLKIKEGEGIGYIHGNVFEYEPPVVNKETNVKVEIFVIDRDSNAINKRNVFRIVVLPQKYLTPQFRTYKLKPNTSIDVLLESVTDDYSYVASVLEGYGSVTIHDNYLLIYTAPNTALSQNVGVSLELLYKRTRSIYKVVINFNIVVNNEDVDVSENIGSISKLQEQVDGLKAEIIEINTNVNTVKDSLVLKNANTEEQGNK